MHLDLQAYLPSSPYFNIHMGLKYSTNQPENFGETHWMVYIHVSPQSLLIKNGVNPLEFTISKIIMFAQDKCTQLPCSGSIGMCLLFIQFNKLLQMPPPLVIIYIVLTFRAGYCSVDFDANIIGMTSMLYQFIHSRYLMENFRCYRQFFKFKSQMSPLLPWRWFVW